MSFKYILTMIIPALLALSSSAADLPKMANDKAVTKGKLPNGMSYYIVANPSVKGMADFALVQKTGRMTSDTISALNLARETLGKLPYIAGGISPQKFFISNGVNPDRNGFVEVGKDYTIYRFSNLLLAQKGSLLDSAIVVMMGMTDRLAQMSDPECRKWYSAADNAIIISGDLDSKAVAQKLNLLSYITPASESLQRPAYEWVPTDSARFSVCRDSSAVFSEVRFSWTAPRVPDNFIGTIQPFIQKMYVAQLGEIAVMRIRKRFEQDAIPCASVSYRHYPSSEGAGDETFTISMVLEEGHMKDALAVVSETLSSLETSGAGTEELEIVRRRRIRTLGDRVTDPVKSNRSYVDLCIRSFLYGAPVASDSDILKVYTSRAVAPDTEQALFREVTDALLDPEKNLSVTCRTKEELTADQVSAIIDEAWSRGKELQAPAAITVSDTLYSISPSPKVSVKSPKKDPMSGGLVWTFSNGFKVVYRNMATSGKIYWSMGLNSGFGNIEDLERGEGAFVGDLLWQYRIAGMKGEDFRKFLELNDIEMSARVSLSATALSGTVQKEDVRLLLRVLTAVANEREPDPEAYAAYMRNENMRLKASAGTNEDRKVVIDSLMCPDYNYSSIKSSGKLTENLAEKADRFYDDCFSRMNNGVLVIVGDIDETELKKELLMRVGSFRTQKSAFYRPAVNYQPVSGWSTHIDAGNENSVYLALSVPMPLTAENKMASQIASNVLRNRISSALEDAGMYVGLHSNTRTSPQERFNVMIYIKEASEDGFAEQRTADPLEALRAVRSTLRDLETADISDAVVKAYKEWLKNDIAYRQKDPRYWTSAISMRYLEGKDFTTGYKAKIDAVTADKVRQILVSLNNASKVEYIITRK